MKPLQLGERLRKLLLENPSGMTARDLSKADGTPMDTIISAMYRNYGFYIGGWECVAHNTYRAVWCCVPVPMDAQRPANTAISVDAKEAAKQRKAAEYKARRQADIEQRKRARAEFKAKREAEKIAEKLRKAEAKAERQRMEAEAKADRERAEREHKAKEALNKPAGGDGYVPAKTRWVTPPPWAQGA